MAVAYAMCVAIDSLKALLGHLEAQFGWVILENVVDVQFLSVGQDPDGFRFDQTFDPASYERGRAFGEQMEMRWRRKHDQYRVLLLTETSVFSLPEATAGIEPVPEPVPLVKPNNDRSLPVVLWGEWQNPQAEPDLPSSDRLYWYEARIPRFLAYPQDNPAKRLAIEVARYRIQPEKLDTQLGWSADFIYRFVRLKEMPIDEEAKGE